jgi:hypothetical protein
VAFQEMDMSQMSQAPASDLFMKMRRWLLDAFAAGGAELDMGSKLYATFRRAGIPDPKMIAATQIACGPDPPECEYTVRVLRSLLPVIEQRGIADSAEIGIDSLAARSQEDAIANDRVFLLGRAVGAWAHLPAVAIAHPWVSMPLSMHSPGWFG